ncbi:MAG TPA: hypothetical protein VFU36_12285 [Jatrophihabitans sp.]|nr:hypothetical protein [Jatrophihabitans sp.]
MARQITDSAVAQSEAWLDAVNPDDVPNGAIDDREDLRRIGMALIAIETAEQDLVSAVADARANKRSWTDIANVLGVSRQAARQRFDDRVAACLTSQRTLTRAADPGGSGKKQQK